MPKLKHQIAGLNKAVEAGLISRGTRDGIIAALWKLWTKKGGE